jgi:hypothetical protein
MYKSTDNFLMPDACKECSIDNCQGRNLFIELLMDQPELIDQCNEELLGELEKIREENDQAK